MRDQIEVLDSLQSVDMELSKVEAELDEYPKKSQLSKKSLRNQEKGWKT